MSLEFLMGLLAVVGGLFVLGWIFCAVEDFRQEMIRRQRGTRTGWKRFYEYAGPPADVEARLPPMAPAGRYGMDVVDKVGCFVPADPPAGWDKTVSRSKAGRQEE